MTSLTRFVAGVVAVLAGAATVAACADAPDGLWMAGGPVSPSPSVSVSVSVSVSPSVPVSPSASASPVNDPAADVRAAAAYAGAHHVRTGIAILDLKTGQYYSAGDADGLFASASVVKVLIATRLLATGQMTGATETLGISMIERSDDDAANTLWSKAGGPDVLPWVADHYDIPFLGTPNTRAGYWGNTHISPKGMVYLYRAIIRDPKVGPWLLNAMHHAQRTAKDGTNQFFGIPSATTGFGVKQGWAAHSADNLSDATVNTTGYVNDDRYAVAILTEGQNDNSTTNSRGYNPTQGAVVTHMAKLVLPSGRIR